MPDYNVRFWGLNVSKSILYAIRCWTGSQWRDFNTGVICVQLPMFLYWCAHPCFAPAAASIGVRGKPCSRLLRWCSLELTKACLNVSVSFNVKYFQTFPILLIHVWTYICCPTNAIYTCFCVYRLLLFLAIGQVLQKCCHFLNFLRGTQWENNKMCNILRTADTSSETDEKTRGPRNYIYAG